MIVYWILVFVCLPYLLINVNSHAVKNKKIFSLFLMFILFIFSSLRFGIGTDYYSYYNYFENLPYVKEKFEFLYHVLNLGTKFLFNNPQSIFVISSGITLFIIYVTTMKYSINPGFTIIIFIFGFFYFDSLNIVRQYIAVAITTYSTHRYLLDKQKNIKFIIGVLCASLFHTSALLAVSFIVIKRIKILGLATNFIVLFLTSVIFLSADVESIIFETIGRIPFLNEYIVYNDFNDDIQSTPWDLIVYLVIYLIGVFVYKYKKDKSNTLYFKFYLNAVFCVLLLKIGALNNKFFDRPSAFLSIFIIFLLPILVKNIPIKEKGIVSFFIAVMFMIYCYVRIATGQAGVENFEFYNLF